MIRTSRQKIQNTLKITMISQIFWILLIFLFQITFSNAQDITPVDELRTSLESPYDAVYTHVRYLQDDMYKPEISASTFDIGGSSEAEADEIALMLLQIYKSKNLDVNLENIPDDPDYIDSVSGKHKYAPFPQMPEIYLVKKGDKWVYSRETVRKIPELYDSTHLIDMTSFIGGLSEPWSHKFIGLKLWQWVGIAIFILVGIMVYYLLKFFFSILLYRMFSKFKRKDVFQKYVKPIAGPFSIFAVIFLVDVFLIMLQLPSKFAYYISVTIKVIQPIVITLMILRITNFIGDLLERMASKTKTKLDNQLVPFARTAMKFVVLILGVFYVLTNLGIDITPLLAGVSIGGLAVALAAKDTVRNLFGSVTIFVDTPFEIGDWIIFDGVEGTVEEVGVRSTRVRTFYNSVITIPNGNLADMKIDNMGKRQYRRYVSRISITYDTPPDLIEAFVKGLRKIVDMHPHTNKENYQIHLNDMGDSAIVVLFYIFFDAPDWTKELESRHEIIYEVISLAHDLGVRFAFPTQTLHIEDFPEKKSLTPSYTESSNDFMDKVEKRKYFSK
ncbi:MAG: mechanosensitive ion channel protein [Ignavibacteriae bacterium HGW-Ignavibacteriae-1]|nr:MAG: mechanosensitive ion channel protein [Ignavibacteriae bacterium HGW-Ignavibacteriae-1]